ncbi:DnaJ domain [Musa troglodytarum]|uniref:DnaJ domain n=1 Tax=Musa troglodytarum TaxID=320322 RepID=A0A9E7FXA0_9LILI|nr:DnaJ domain [Musa troglodytarum]
MSPSSLSSSQFLGLRIAPPPSITATSLSPRSPSSLRSPRVSAAYAATAECPRAAHAPGPAVVANPSSLYDVLGVSPGASGQEIKAAYRQLALACHPDVIATGRKGASAEKFMRVHAAYATLSDPGKRADYDRELAAATMLVRHRWPEGRTYARSTSFPRYGRRTWETDQCW